jgi:ankyrin repeat protein
MEAMQLIQKLLQRTTQEPTMEAESHPASSTTSHPSSLPESAFLEVLTTLKRLPDFKRRLSTVNEHGQSLLHLAIHLRYRELVQRLVDWGMDLNLKDVNGATALHTAYLCGDASITRILERCVAIQLSLDKLGRPPTELASGATIALEECNQEVKPVHDTVKPAIERPVRSAGLDKVDLKHPPLEDLKFASSPAVLS